MDQISDRNILEHCSDESFQLAPVRLPPDSIELNQAIFSISAFHEFHTVSIIQQDEQTMLFCDCERPEHQLCPYQAQALRSLIKQEDLLAFFNTELRHEKIRQVAYDFGLENEENLDLHFKLEYIQNRLAVLPAKSEMVAVTQENLASMRESILQTEAKYNKAVSTTSENTFIVVRHHKYYKHLQIGLYTSDYTQQGKPKNPLEFVATQELIWQTTSPEQVKFYLGMNRLENLANTSLIEQDISALRAIIHNPLEYPAYYHTPSRSDTVSASSLSPIKLRVLKEEFNLKVTRRNDHYRIQGQVVLHNQEYDITDLDIRLQCFVVLGDYWYLIDKTPVLAIVNLLKQKGGSMHVYNRAFDEFKSQFLNPIADKITIDHDYVTPATPQQLAETEILSSTEKLLYLEDFGSHINLIPVMRYGEVEIPIRTKRQIFEQDKRGNEFLVARDPEKENELTALIIRQHPDFPDQLENELDHFYLHRRQFLNEEWFLPTFEEWRTQGITILGFNQLKKNKLNPYKVQIDIKIVSGLNWFNATIDARFGSKKAPIKKIQVAVKNKSKYVELDDGTLGILPQEWIERFSEYFTAGDITDDLLTIPKVNFSVIDQLFEAEMMDETVRDELHLYRQKLNDFTQIKPVKTPKSLKGTLRKYQQEGLSWLNFLDDYNFGGCLADDMGLGKSIQIIAFILLQREKVQQNTNLLIVPTTLIFNWQQEFRKFAPDLKVNTLQGPDRQKDTSEFDQSEVILLSYNTLLTDVMHLKRFTFNYIFLDESQQIKNPSSQRYKAARLLRSRNKVVVTGTPVENNTFDLYSQLSFACPGLFGNQRNFKELYAVPIDQFKSSRHARELQQKIHPFLMRRTKEQVAKELPRKTETVLYCPLGEEQRKVYDAYEKEFRDYISATDAEEVEKSPMHALKGLTKLRQICNSTRLLKGDEIKGKKTSSKIEALMEQISINSEHHKMLVFSQFVSMLELIKAELEANGIGYTMLTGSTRNREAVVRSFQENEEINVFLISLKAGGTGLNLTEASYVYLVDPWWNPAVENQAIDRIYRIGQKKNVTAIRMICPDTVEEKIMQLQQSKKLMTNRVIAENSNAPLSLSKADLLNILR